MLAASSAVDSVRSGPSQRSASTRSPGAPNTDPTISGASSASKVDRAPQDGTTGASSGALSRAGAQAANKPPGRSTRRASATGAAGSSQWYSVYSAATASAH